MDFFLSSVKVKFGSTMKYSLHFKCYLGLQVRKHSDNISHFISIRCISRKTWCQRLLYGDLNIFLFYRHDWGKFWVPPKIEFFRNCFSWRETRPQLAFLVFSFVEDESCCAVRSVTGLHPQFCLCSHTLRMNGLYSIIARGSMLTHVKVYGQNSTLSCLFYLALSYPNVQTA